MDAPSVSVTNRKLAQKGAAAALMICLALLLGGLPPTAAAHGHSLTPDAYSPGGFLSRGIDLLSWVPGADQFFRPALAALNVDTMPDYIGGLTISGAQNYFIQVINTGAQTDTFDMSAAFVSGQGDSSWSVKFYKDKAATIELQDTNSNSIKDTGPILPGGVITVTVRLQSPGGEEVGDYSTFDVTATSSNDPGQKSTTRIRGAVPEGHFLGFIRSDGVDVRRLLPNGQLGTHLSSLGSLNHPSLVVNGSRYFYTWNSTSGSVIDVEYAVLDYSLSEVKPVTKLTAETPESGKLKWNRFPAQAASPDGRTGVVWSRVVTDLTTPLTENHNIYFAILDQNGDLVAGPINVTGNNAFGTPGDNEVPAFNFPTITATRDNRFVLGWIDERTLTGGLNTDLNIAIYDSDGNEEQRFEDYVEGNPGQELYRNPSLLELPSNRLLIFFSEETQTLPAEFTPVYAIYDITPGDEGIELQPRTVVPGATGNWIDTAHFPEEDKIIAAWTNTDTQVIQFAIFDDNGSNVSLVSGTLKTLTTPDGLDSNYVSVITSEQHAVLGWADLETGTHMYYALVNVNGSILTPPVHSSILNDNANNTLPLSFNQNGQSLAPVPEFKINLPLIQR